MYFNKLSFISYINLRYIFYKKYENCNFIYIYIYLIILNIYFINKLFLQQLGTIRFNSFLKKKTTTRLTIQRAPMAHRRWSQEQYKVIIYYWIVCYCIILKNFWINFIYLYLPYFTMFYHLFYIYFSSSILLFKNNQLWLQKQFILYY